MDSGSEEKFVPGVHPEKISWPQETLMTTRNPYDDYEPSKVTEYSTQLYKD